MADALTANNNELRGVLSNDYGIFLNCAIL